MLREAEVKALGELAGDALGGAGAIVHDVQRDVAGRVFGVLGGGAAPVRVAHDGISAVVHSVSAGLRAVPQAAAARSR